ncbi:hypothetical protein [Changchengzhania lutea]|uniref:hypothetical protein n=1 Tax=Changchengzhania lutea TaxID=2049305 RepID=UPI00115E3D27|nr:hypothetical protein [Changchengzhania lutea]
MKKLAYFIVGLIIGALLTYYFCPGLVDMPTMDAKVDKPTGVITIIEAEELSVNWEKNNKTEIDSTIDVEEPRKPMRTTMWTLKDVEDYLYYAKHQSDTIGFTMTGVRVYLGNYGENAEPSKKNRNTMFIVPTGYKNTSKASSAPNFNLVKEEDIPVDPLNQGGGGDGGYPQ